MDDRELGLDGRDARGEGEPVVDQSLLDRLDDRTEVEADGPVRRGQDSLFLSGQQGDELGVGPRVRAHPQPLERVAAHEVADAIPDELANTDRGRAGEASQRVGDPRRHALAGQSVDSLVDQVGDVETAEDLVGDPVGNGLLDRRIRRQRRDGGDVPFGVGHLVAGPDAHDRHRREDAAHDDERAAEVTVRHMATAGRGRPGRRRRSRTRSRATSGAGDRPGREPCRATRPEQVRGR